MQLLTETQAIAKVNQIIGQSGFGPEYRVYSLRSADWGWVMMWMPKDPSKMISGASPYLCHKNGFVREHNEICHHHNLRNDDIDGVIKAFIIEAERRIRI